MLTRDKNGKFDLEITAQRRHKGPKMGSLESLYRTSYWSSIETIALNCLWMPTEGKRGRGRLTETWRRISLKDLARAGVT